MDTSCVARPRVRVVVASLLAVLAVAACGDDDEPTGDPTTTITTSATVPVTPAPTAATTAATAPPTTAPATSTSTTTTSTTTTTTSTTTTTTVAPTTTARPPGTELALTDTGIGQAAFGADPDEVLAYLESVIGPPSADSGWADPNSAFGVCPGSEVRGVAFSDLTVLFSDSSDVETGSRHFFSYTFGPPFATRAEPSGLATDRGITLGSTVSELRVAHPEVIVNEGDDIFGPSFFVSEQLRGFLSGAGDTDVVTTIIGGIGCGE